MQNIIELLQKCLQNNNGPLQQQMSQQSNLATYEIFLNRLKSKFKKQKQERKENLRQIHQRKLVQSSEGSNDEQYLKKTGNKWWSRINRHYFLKLSQQFIQYSIRLTTTDDIIGFGSSISPLLPYYQQVIYNSSPGVFHDNSIRLLYRIMNKIDESERYLLAGYLTKNSGNQNCEESHISAIIKPAIYSFHRGMRTDHTNHLQKKVGHAIENQHENYKENLMKENELQKIGGKVYQGSPELLLCGFTESQQFIEKCLKYETIWRNEDLTQIEKEISCWEDELQEQHQQNMKQWDKIEEKIEQQKENYPEIKAIDSKIEQLKKQLIRSETISYFRSGYGDKTVDDYNSAVTYAHQISSSQQKKQPKKPGANQFYETDCKICFCTKNQPSNKVIYCDNCNTSFHQSCYGIQFLDQDKQLLCDVCTYVQKWQSANKGVKCDVPICQICGRGKFPIKNINDHFYHVSCLILFDFAEIIEFKISLKKGITHSTIMQSVIENQMDQDYCQFCFKNSYSGMKFNCSSGLCAKSFHPICAYLNGCFFQINRKNIGGIEVKVQCRDHIVSQFADLAFQVYIRRYLCNYRHTSQTKEEDFKQSYHAEIDKLKGRATLSPGGVRRILEIKKIKGDANTQKKKTEMKKSQSVISNTSSNKNQEKKSESNQDKTK